jgi:type IV pilus assembly protein PilY1
MKKAFAVVQIAFLLLLWNVPLLNVQSARADDSDIFGNNISPNVMIFLDNSGSMADSVYSSPYAVNTTYNTPLTYTTTKVYQQKTGKKTCSPDPSPCYTVYANDIASVASSSARSKLSTTGNWTGKISGSQVSLYYGNYLNYLACSTCSALDTKINVAKRVLTDLVNNVRGVRFGLMDFKYSSPVGATMVAEIGSSRTTITSALSNISPDSNTPTGEALKDVDKYFKGQYGSYSSPIQYSCQPNFVIVISDGLWNGSVDPAPVGTTMSTTDHSSTFTGSQNVIVHTVGFGLDPSDPGVASLQATATNGGGSYYAANSEVELQLALQAAISQILTGSFSFANPLVPTTGTSGATRAYLASFQSDPSRPFWRGYLKAYTRDSNGLIQTDVNNIPLESNLVWDAGDQLSQKTADSRVLYTVVNGARTSFTKTNNAITNALVSASSNTEHDNIIDFIRGIDTYDENANGITNEQRAWKLGDIFHSTPVLVGAPFLPSNDSTYNTFKTNNVNRTAILLVGSDDGVLHAFRESDGAELWGFIPPDVLDTLKDMTANAGQHDFFVDGDPVVADVNLGGTWKTVAIFGERRGGKSYYALDITDTTNPLYLWSFTDSKMGETWSTPVIGKVKMSNNSDKWVAFVGGGYDTALNNNSGKALFTIDLSNGSKLWEYYHSTGATDDKQYMNFSIPSSPAAVDVTNDGYIDTVYVGDVGGQLWKFDVSAAATISGGLVTNWTGKRIFAAASSQTNPPAAGEFYPAQAIYGSPTLSYDTMNNLWIYFGTGDRNHPNNTSSNRFYGIKENINMTNGNTLTESALTNVTSGSGAVSQGWFVVLNGNEKVLASADAFNKAVFFTTFTPTTVATCSNSGGDAKLYSINLTTGDAAINLSTGSTLAPGGSALVNAKNVGTGIPSRPEIVISQSGNAGNPYVITGTTNRQITNTPVPPVATRKLLAWREVF